jgi:hypothetical protein
MKTPAHKGRVADHPATTIHASGGPHETSIGHAIAQALADTDKPSAGQAATETHLPPVNIPGIHQPMAPAFTPHSPGDSPKSDGLSLDASSPDAFQTPVAAMRDSLLAGLHQDPSRSDNPNDWLPGDRSSAADLRAAVGITYGSSDAGGKNQSAAETLIEHTRPGQEKAEGLLGKLLHPLEDQSQPDELRSDGKWHVTISFASDQGITRFYDYVRTQPGEDGKYELNFTTIVDNNNHTVTTIHADGSTVTEKGGQVVDTTPPLKLPSSTPDNDRPSTLPPLSDLLKGALLDQVQHPAHNGDTTNVVGDEFHGPGLPSNLGTPFVDHTVQNGPADPMGPATGIGSDGVPASGSPSTPSPGMDPNLTNTLDATSSGTGPEEPGHPPEIKQDQPGAANAGAAGSDPALHSGEHQNTIPLLPPVGSIAETPAEKASHQLQDALIKHDGPGEPAASASHAVEKIDLGLGVHPDGGNGFAELIKAAQNPVQSGLAIHPVVPEVPQHLAVGADIAGHHNFGPHGGDELSTVHAAPIATIHDGHIDHHVEQHAAPMLDHIAAHH